MFYSGRQAGPVPVFLNDDWHNIWVLCSACRGGGVGGGGGGGVKMAACFKYYIIILGDYRCQQGKFNLFFIEII